MGKPGFSGLTGYTALVTRLLRGERLTTETVASSLGVQPEAARRYIRRLGKVPGVEASRQGSTLNLRLTLIARRRSGPADVAAACLMSSLATTMRDTGLRKPMERIRDDVVDGSKLKREATHLDRKFWFVASGGDTALPRAQDTFAELIDAVLRSRSLAFDYTHFDGHRTRESDVEPLTLALYDHQFYVLARKPGVPLYPFRFARMENVRVGGTFVYPTPGEYEPSSLFQNVFGIYIAQNAPVQDVHIRLAGTWKHYVESHRWHESQRHTLDDSGHVVVSLRVRPSIELRRWILWFGADAEVLQPQELRQEVAKDLRGAVANYARSLGGDDGHDQRAGRKRSKKQMEATGDHARRGPAAGRK